MKVKELIEKLQEYDENRNVYIWNGEWCETDPLHEIRTDDDGDIVLDTE